MLSRSVVHLSSRDAAPHPSWKETSREISFSSDNAANMLWKLETLGKETRPSLVFYSFFECWMHRILNKFIIWRPYPMSSCHFLSEQCCMDYRKYIVDLRRFNFCIVALFFIFIFFFPVLARFLFWVLAWRLLVFTEACRCMLEPLETMKLILNKVFNSVKLESTDHRNWSFPTICLKLFSSFDEPSVTSVPFSWRLFWIQAPYSQRSECKVISMLK
jgi:hypothetical protein